MIKENYVRKVVEVHRVVDGDTIEVWVDMGDYTHKFLHIRFLGVDTPERGQEGYYDAKEFVIQELEGAEEIHVQTHKWKKGGFGRYLGEVFITKNNSQYSLNSELLMLGLAEVYKR